MNENEAAKVASILRVPALSRLIELHRGRRIARSRGHGDLRVAETLRRYGLIDSERDITEDGRQVAEFEIRRRAAL